MMPGRLVAGMEYPDQPGKFTFAFGRQSDTAIAGGYADTAIASKPVLVAKGAHVWSGSASLKPSNLAQIPNGGTEKLYLCVQTPGSISDNAKA
jgi:hypothetical protein